MITLSNGTSFEFVAASGALAFDGGGWPWERPLRWVGRLKPELFFIVTKSLTLKPRRGNLRGWNPLRAVRLIREGTLNAVGLTNPGIEWWCTKIYPRIEKSGGAFACSIAGADIQEFMEMAIRLQSCAALKAIELNVSCPNSPGELQANTQAVVDLVKALWYVNKLPLILKLSVTHDYLKIAKETEGEVEAISINSVPWDFLFPGKKSPLARFGGGGVSGKAARKATWKMAAELARGTTTPVIGAGVWDYEDIDRLFEIGASAVAFGSVFLRYPWRPTLFVERWRHS